MGIRNNPKLDEKSLWEYALRALSQRAQSAGEIRQKLLQRAQSTQDLDAVLAKLGEYGMVDDRRFSEAFASSRLQNNGFGRFRVLNDLRRKRVAPAIAETAVDKAFTGTDEPQLIEQFLKRKYRNIDLRQFLKEEKNLASAYRRLRIAGFGSASTLAVLKRYSQRMEEWSEPAGEPED
jgi:regulatory protein